MQKVLDAINDEHLDRMQAIFKQHGDKIPAAAQEHFSENVYNDVKRGFETNDIQNLNELWKFYQQLNHDISDYGKQQAHQAATARRKFGQHHQQPSVNDYLIPAIKTSNQLFNHLVNSLYSYGGSVNTVGR